MAEISNYDKSICLVRQIRNATILPVNTHTEIETMEGRTEAPAHADDQHTTEQQQISTSLLPSRKQTDRKPLSNRQETIEPQQLLSASQQARHTEMQTNRHMNRNCTAPPLHPLLTIAQTGESRGRDRCGNAARPPCSATRPRPHLTTAITISWPHHQQQHHHTMTRAMAHALNNR